MIDPRPLDPPSYWLPDHDELLASCLLHDLIPEGTDPDDLETWELEELLREYASEY